MAMSSSEGIGNEGGAVVRLFMCFDAIELRAGSDKIESLLVGIRGKANRADILVGVCYKSPNQAEEDDTFYN